MKAAVPTMRKVVPRLGRKGSGTGSAAPNFSKPEALYDFEVVGHHLTDPDRLLVLGDDEHLYALDVQNGRTAPTQFSTQWLTDTCAVPINACANRRTIYP
jgi:hypothetical protein